MNANAQTVARFVTVTMGLVIGLTFLFGFGNVFELGVEAAGTRVRSAAGGGGPS